MASKLWVTKSVGWFIVKTLGINNQKKTQMIGNSQDMGLALRRKSKETWDLQSNVNLKTNSLSNLPKCKGGLTNVFCNIDGLLDAKGRP